jgi:hypothetical protein
LRCSLTAPAVTLGAALLVAGCSLEPGAASAPTYQADVLPIFMARCVRCHGDPPMGDPTSTNPTYQGPPVASFRIDMFADTPACDPDSGVDQPPCVFGASGMDLRTLLAYITDGQMYRMPPDPAPALTKYQIDTIQNWAAEKPPLEK